MAPTNIIEYVHQKCEEKWAKAYNLYHMQTQPMPILNMALQTRVYDSRNSDMQDHQMNTDKHKQENTDRKNHHDMAIHHDNNE